MTPDRFDVIIVGGRVAGASLAAHLARSGVAVCLVERAHELGDTLSQHMFPDVAPLERLGVMDRLLATGAPLLVDLRLTIDDVDLSSGIADAPMLCIRRRALDGILLDHARRCGADVRTGTTVVGVVTEAGRLCGVRTSTPDGGAHELRAAVVVGADGRNSVVARATGARRYNVTPSERAAVWTYYRGVDAPPTAHYHRRGRDLFVAAPADDGVFMATWAATNDDFDALRHDPAAALARAIQRCRPVAGLLAGATPIRSPYVVPRWEGYFRESAGPGWALVGDAGHFKDPAAGQGIPDALRQAEALSAFVFRGLDGGRLDAELEAWWRWRDRDATAMYWFAQDLGLGGDVPALVAQILRRVARTPGTRRELYDVFRHVRPPATVLTPTRLMVAAAGLLVRGEHPRRDVLDQAGRMMRLDARRRRLARHPEVEVRGEAPRRPARALVPMGGGVRDGR
jgi:2-polyprenyl-6-methoxyphenol hydroxylase-like FAD-dependent oxidoreductase